MKSRIALFFVITLFSVNCFAVTSACFHDGGYAPTLRNMGSYSHSDYLADPHHAIRSELILPFIDDDWDIVTMSSGGHTRTLSYPIIGMYGYWSFEGMSARGIYENPIFWAAPSGTQYCDHQFDNKEVTTTFTVSPSTTVKAGDSITITWNGVNASYCEDTGTSGTWATSGTLPLIATEGLNGTHSMICYYQDGTFANHIHDSDESVPFTLTVNPSCYVTSEENHAVTTMSSWSTLPYEQGVSFDCISDSISNGDYVTSFSACTAAGCPPATMDPCYLTWAGPGNRPNRIAAAHSHPFFATAAEYLPDLYGTGSVGCYGPDVQYPDPTLMDLQDINAGNENFSGDDYSAAPSLGGSVYLRTPTGVLKKYDGTEKVLP